MTSTEVINGASARGGCAGVCESWFCGAGSDEEEAAMALRAGAVFWGRPDFALVGAAGTPLTDDESLFIAVIGALADSAVMVL
jgi:hypothetical protein